MPQLSSGTVRRLLIQVRAAGGARWMALAWLVVFWRLGYTTFLDPDEAHYAEITREMLRAGSWLVPLLDGQPFIDKPVLFHWIQGLSMWAFGESEFSARLPSALAAIALFVTTRQLGVRLFDRAVGESAALMFATIPLTFALANIGLFDMVFAAFLFGGLSALLAAGLGGRPRLELLGYALIALAVMVKGPVALVLIASFCGAAWIAGGESRTFVDRLRWRTGLPLAAVAASPWFVWMYLEFGSAFVQGYVLAGNVYYVTLPAAFSTRAVDHAFYLRAFLGGFFPWTIVMLGRGVDLVRRRATGLPWTIEERLLWLWVAVVIGLFSVARFKLDHYIFPAAPACCLLAARAWRDAAERRSSAVGATRASVLLIAALLISGGAFLATAIFELNLELPPAAILLPATLFAGGVVMLARCARVGWHVPSAPLGLVASLLTTFCLVVIIGFPTLLRARPTALAGRTVRYMTASRTPVGIYRHEHWRASLRYYAERPLTRLTTPEDVAAFAASDTRVYMVMIRRDFREVRRNGLQLREVFRCRAVVGTTRTRSGLRRQQWDDLIIVTNAPARHETQARSIQP